MTYTKIKFALALSALALLAGGTVTVALSQTNTKATPPAGLPAKNQTALVIAAQFVDVPDDVLDGIWQPRAKSTTAILSLNARTNLLAKLKENGVTVVSSPRMAFVPIPGEKMGPGTISVTKSIKVSGTNADVGTILYLAPVLSTDAKSLSLDVTAEYPRLIDNTIQTLKISASATLNLNPGQTLLIEEPVPDSNLSTDSSTNLLVFVTPQITHFTQRLQHIIPRKTN